MTLPGTIVDLSALRGRSPSEILQMSLEATKSSLVPLIIVGAGYLFEHQFPGTTIRPCLSLRVSLMEHEGRNGSLRFTEIWLKRCSVALEDLACLPMAIRQL